MGNKIFIILFLVALALPITLAFQCDTNTYSEHGFTDDKVYWLCYFNDTASRDCVSYIKDNESGVVQVNPVYQKKSESLIGVFNDVEDRESFRSENGLVSIFFTKENLLFDGRDYTYGVRCSTGSAIDSFEKNLTPEYKNLNAPITRTFWLKQNIAGLFLGVFLVFVLVVLVVMLINTARSR